MKSNFSESGCEEFNSNVRRLAKERENRQARLVTVVQLPVPWKFEWKTFSYLYSLLGIHDMIFKYRDDFTFSLFNLDDDVDVLRIRLWTAATNGPMVHPTDNIWAWTIMEKWYRQEKTHDSFTRAPWESYKQIDPVAKQNELAKEINFASRVSLSILKMFL
jgi:hypothetical protein